MALTDNLISYWKLDESSGTRNDSHGSLSLTDNNTVGSGTGKINSAASFVRASSEWLGVDSGTSFNFGSGDFAFQVWINPSTIDNGTRMNVLSKDNSSSNGRQFVVEVNGLNNDTTRGAIRLIIFANDSAFHGQDTPVDTLTTGSWYHVIAQRSGNAFEIWVNGVSQTLTTAAGSVSLPQTLQSTTTAFDIGRREYSGYNDYFDGLIDEVGIWSRALTSGEIASLYNGGSGLAYPFGGGASLVVTPFRNRVMSPGHIFWGKCLC